MKPVLNPNIFPTNKIKTNKKPLILSLDFPHKSNDILISNKNSFNDNTTYYLTKYENTKNTNRSLTSSFGNSNFLHKKFNLKSYSFVNDEKKNRFIQSLISEIKLKKNLTALKNPLNVEENIIIKLPESHKQLSKSKCLSFTHSSEASKQMQDIFNYGLYTTKTQKAFMRFIDKNIRPNPKKTFPKFRDIFYEKYKKDTVKKNIFIRTMQTSENYLAEILGNNLSGNKAFLLRRIKDMERIEEGMRRRKMFIKITYPLIKDFTPNFRHFSLTKPINNLNIYDNNITKQPKKSI